MKFSLFTQVPPHRRTCSTEVAACYIVDRGSYAKSISLSHVSHRGAPGARGNRFGLCTGRSATEIYRLFAALPAECDCRKLLVLLPGARVPFLFPPAHAERYRSTDRGTL